VTYLRRYRGDPKHDAPGISELLQEGPQVFGKNFLKSRPLFDCTCTSWVSEQIGCDLLQYQHID
jgi:hypothetical protein